MRITKEEMYLKVVYYGPGLSGKTTNLEVIHKQLPDERKGDLTSIATETDRTIFFDCLPYEIQSTDGRKIKIQLFTIPGQVYYKSTRKMILQGADGIVFVADSSKNKKKENIESYHDLCDILEIYRVDIKKIPLVIQYNKRDLELLLPVEELEHDLNHISAPSFCASAINRIGVMETLKRILHMILVRLKILSDSPQAEQLFQQRKQTLAKKILSLHYSNDELAEYLGMNMEPRRRGPVLQVLQELKQILQKKIEYQHTEHLYEILQTIQNLDPAVKKLTPYSSLAPNPPNQKLHPNTLSKIQKLKTKIQQNPNDLLSHKYLLNLYLKNKMTKEAVQELFATAKIHYKNGNHSLAQKTLEYILQLDPQNKNAKKILLEIQKT